jgi:hypothetical protein
VETSLEIAVELRMGPEQSAPDVRFWVDAGWSADLGSEIEVALELRRRWVWIGTLTLPQPAPSFFYRLGISACAGVDWTLRIHQPGSGRDLMVDEDRMTMPKCWLLGSCDLPRARPDGAACELKAASTRTRGADGPRVTVAAAGAGAIVVALAPRRRQL